MTALLNVTVDSSKGKEEVLAFKEFMRQNLGNIKIDVSAGSFKDIKMSVDEAALNTSLVKALGKQHQISLDEGSIVKAVGEALTRAFSTKYVVGINGAHLTEQVEAAIKAGMGGTLHVGGGIIPTTNTGVISGGMTPAMMAEAVRASMVPLIDKMDMALKNGPVQDAASRRRNASVSTSGRADGMTVGIKSSISPDEALGLIAQAKELKAAEDAQKAADKEAEIAARNAVRIQEEKWADIRRAEQENDDWEKARQRERDAAFLAMERATAAEHKALMEEAWASEHITQEAEADRAHAGMLAQQRAFDDKMAAERKEADELADAQIRFHLEHHAELLRIDNSLKVAEAKKAADKLIAEQKIKDDAIEKAEAEHNLRMKELYERNRIEAAKQFTGNGVNIAAAGQLAGQTSHAEAKDFLGSQSYLLNMTDSLEGYRRKQSEVVEQTHRVGTAHAEMAQFMNEGHSAVRGLTGALGQMWLTWGSIVPLIAGAAIGGALRSVIEVGKDTEYQLAFVSALSGGAVVDLGKFGDAVRGNLILPKDAAEGMRALAQNGLNVADSLKVLPEVLRLATVGEMSVADAALGATGVMAAFNLTINDMGRVGDVFAKAAADSNTSVQGMVEAMKKASTVSDLYHVTLEQTAATLEVMAKRNITGTAAGTAFTNMMTEIAAPTESAKKAISLLNLEFYKNGALKDYGSLLAEIQTKTATLNEKSRIDLLGRIFGERGSKALNAVLSDFDIYSKAVKELTDNTEGFSQTVVDALGESTQGRLKGLATEFQLSSDAAFTGAKGSVDSFVESLRTAASSTDFQTSLSALAANVASLSNFFLEHGRIIGEVGAAYVSFNLIENLVGTALRATAGAFGIATVAQVEQAAAAALTTGAIVSETVALEEEMVAARAAAGALGLATFGLSAVFAVIVPLIVEWALFTDHTDAATIAIENNNKVLTRQSQNLDDELERLRSTNTELAIRNGLIRNGVSFEQATKLAHEQVSDSEIKDKRSELQTAVDDAKKKYDAKLLDQSQADPNGLGIIPGLNDAKEAYEGAERALILYNTTIVQSDQKTADTRVRVQRDLFGTMSKDAEEFNAKYEKFKAARGKDYKGDDLKMHLPTLVETDEGYAATLDEHKRALQGQMDNKSIPDGHAAALAMQAEKAETSALFAEIKNREDALKAEYTFRQALQEKTFAMMGNNAAIKAAVELNLEQQHLDDLKALNDRSIAQLEKDEEGYAGDSGKAERIKIQKHIDGLKAEYAQMDLNIKQKRLLSAIDEENARNSSEAAFNSTVSKIGLSAQNNVNSQYSKFNKQQDNPRDQAYDAAYQSELQKSSGAINAQAQALQKAKDELDQINSRMEQIKGTGDSQIDQYQTEIDKAKELVKVEQGRAFVIDMEAQKGAAIAASTSQSLYDRSQTAGFGWDKFWSEWSANASSNAKIVEDVMGATFNGLTQTFADFATTGKFNFRSLCVSILAEAAKVMSAKVITQLAELGMNMMGGSSSGLGNAGAGDYSNAGLAAAFGGPKAGGGQIMSNSMHEVSEDGPELYNYGGKQYLMAGSKGGEVQPMSRAASAYQSRPTGESSRSTTNNTPVQMNMNVTVNADKTSKVATDATGAEAATMTRMMNEAVRQILVEEQRPGGRLYAMTK